VATRLFGGRQRAGGANPIARFSNRVLTSHLMNANVTMPLDLGRNQREVLRVLWDEPGLKPAEIQARFAWPLNNATLRSVLRVLMRKGYVIRARQGKAFHYQAVAPRKELLRQTAQRMAELFTQGSQGELVAAIVKVGDLSRDELKGVRKAVKKRA